MTSINRSSGTYPDDQFDTGHQETCCTSMTGSLPVIGVPWWLIYYINWWGLHLDDQYWTGHWGMPLMTGINPVIKGYIYLNERFIIGHQGTKLEDWYWTGHWRFPGWLDWYQSARAYLNDCLCGSLRHGTWRAAVLSPPGLRLPPFTLLVSRPVVSIPAVLTLAL